MADTVATYKAMEPLVKSGKAKAIGISNFNASAIEAFLPQVTVKPAINQCGYSIAGHTESLWGRDDATRHYCAAHNITYSAYSPLGGLSGVDVLSDKRVLAVAAAHNKSSAQVALRWVTQQGVTAVTASTKRSHLLSDLAIFDFTLTGAEMAALAKI